MPAALPVFRLLRQDFVGKIPGQKKRVIRHCLQQLLGRIDGKMDAGHVSALLVRTAINDEIQRFLTNTAIIEQRATFPAAAP